MPKRAVLIGCNYPGSKYALNGCVNDVESMFTMLTTHYAFPEENIHKLIDTDESAPQPTGANIKKYLNQVVAASTGEDVLFVHFSGHGTQIADKDGGEADGKDEAICPTDMNLICDDDLREILCKLPPTVKFTMISDCCHSGSMLDHPEQQISGDKAEPAAEDDTMEESEDMTNRAIPQEGVAEVLSEKLGTEVDPAQLRAQMTKVFGDDATAKITGFLAANLDKLNIGGGEEGGGGAARSMFSSLLGGAKAALSGSKKFGAAAPAAGAPTSESVNGALITGCQAHETSADACPSGDKTKAFGALTNALTTTVAWHKSKGRNPTYSQLVSQVRNKLHKSRFTQNPCLECADEHVDVPFVCDD